MCQKLLNSTRFYAYSTNTAQDGKNADGTMRANSVTGMVIGVYLIFAFIL
jgi:hypothetical protein